MATFAGPSSRKSVSSGRIFPSRSIVSKIRRSGLTIPISQEANFFSQKDESVRPLGRKRSDVGIGIGEDEDAVVPELLLDEVELIGVYLGKEAEVSVSDVVVGECTTCQRAERCTELGLRHAPVLDLEEVTTLKVGIQHLLDVRYPKGSEAA